MKPLMWIRKRLAIRIALVVMVVIMLLSIGYIGLQISNAKKTAMQVITSYGTHMGESYSEQMDVEGLEVFLKDPQENELYWTIREKLDQYRTQIGALYTYIMRVDDNQVPYIMIDGQPQDSDSASPINEETEIPAADIEKLLKGQSAFSSLTIDPQYGVYISSYSPIKRPDGTVIGLLGIDIDSSVVDSIASNVIQESIPFYILMIILTLSGIGLIIWVLIRALHPLKRIVSGAESIAKGDLAKAHQYLLEHPVHTEDEVGAMYKAIVTMSTSLNSIIGGIVSNIAQTSDQLVVSSDYLAKEANVLVEMNTRVHRTASQVAKGASTQSISSEESARSMEEITSTIQRISESSSVVSDASSKALKSAESGRDMIKHINDQIGMISSTTEETVNRVTVLRGHSREIQDTLNAISEIASQTKLLAFNATIEAARAGEHGYGFAVIATEVRKLAEDASVSAHQIASLLKDVQHESLRISDAMEGNSKEVQIGRVLSEKAQESITNVVEMFRLVSEQIQEVSAATEQISAGSEEVTASVVEIASIAIASSEQTHQIQEQTDTQLNIVRQVADSAAELSGMTQLLRESATKFKI